MTDHDDAAIPRRAILRASGSALAVPAVGTARAGADRDAASSLLERDCPEATLRPSHGHCEGTSADGCADDHPETAALRDAVRETLASRFPDAGALLDAGFVPYFDALDRDEGGWSHWLSPEHVGDGSVLDPERPESVLVDNRSWRSVGVMFVATRGGERVDPPTVFEDGDDRCAPWHYHAGLPGRFAWAYYRRIYADDDRKLPCRTPCLMHVWTVDHPDGVYAHGGPPPESLELEPAVDPGFETDAIPGEDRLDWDVLPDEATPDRSPGSLPEP